MLELEALENDATCFICQQPYGGEDLATLYLDMPCAVIDLQCNHFIGFACLDRLIETAQPESVTRCPLCRTEWWTNQRVKRLEEDDAGERDRNSTHWAQLMRCDYNMARYFFYGEEEYAELHLPLALDGIRARVNLIHNLHIVLHLPEIDLKLAQLQDKCYISLVDAKFDPKKRAKAPFDIDIDPFKFNNYHLGKTIICEAMFQTLYYWRGHRLWATYRDSIERVAQREKKETLEGLVRAWTEMFPGDEEDWVELILHVLWIADPPFQKEEISMESGGEMDGSRHDSVASAS